MEFHYVFGIHFLLIIYLSKSISCDCDVEAIKHECYKKISHEWPVTNKTDQPTKRVCCWHWDVFDCVELEACEQCSDQLSQEINDEFNHLKANLMNSTCVDYPYGSMRCHLTIGVYAVCFYTFCFSVSVIYLTISYCKKLKSPQLE